MAKITAKDEKALAEKVADKIADKLKGKKGKKKGKARVTTREKVEKRKQNPVSLMALFNKRITTAVKENMGQPALVNRTGAFANSVSVSNIIIGPRGGITIEYDYQKDPYQVFDPQRGRKPWATRDRNPRKIIEKSLRDVAQEAAIKRFTPRAV